MACPHSKAPGSSPLACSLCAGAQPQRVETRDGRTFVDGVDIGAMDPSTSYTYGRVAKLPKRRK